MASVVSWVVLCHQQPRDGVFENPVDDVQHSVQHSHYLLSAPECLDSVVHAAFHCCYVMQTQKHCSESDLVITQ